MRILMTTDTIGGVWTFTRELATGLLEAGCEVTLVSFGRLPDTAQRRWSEAARQRWAPAFDFVADDTPLEWMQENDRAYTAAACRLTRLAERTGAVLLHCNQFCFGALPVDIPKVITAHSDVLSWAKACRNTNLDDSPWLRQYRSLVRKGIAGAHTVVAPTHAMLQALRENFPLPADSRVIANGRSILFPAPAATARKLQAVTAGRLWDEAKNIALLGQVQSPIPLLVAGESSCDAAHAPSHLGQAKLLGPLAEPDLLTLFRESELYLCPSKYEPFGLAPLEAALCGCAILANDIPSLREVWQDGALYFNDAESLSGLLSRLHADAQLRADAQTRSHIRASLYTRESMTSAYLALYRRTLSRDPDKEIGYVA